MASGGTTPGSGVGAVGAALATLKVRLVTSVPFRMVTSFFSTLIETTSTDSTLSPSARMGLIIGLPGPGMISSNARLLERMLVMPANPPGGDGGGGGAGGGAISCGGGG